MPPAAAVVPSPSGTPPSSSPKVASPQAASLPSSSTEHNATAGRDMMSAIHHREVPRRFFHHRRQSSRSRPRSAPSCRGFVPRPPPRERFHHHHHTSSFFSPNKIPLLLKGSFSVRVLSLRVAHPKPPRTRRRVTGAKRSIGRQKMPLVRNDENVDSGTNRK